MEGDSDGVEVTSVNVVDIHPITNMKAPKTFNEEDVREVACEFQTTAVRQITARALKGEYYVICDLQSNIDQIVDVALPRRDIGGEYVAELKRPFNAP